MLAVNPGLRLFGLVGVALAAALAVALHLDALLAGLDAVAVTLENLLGDPLDDGRFLGAGELLEKLRLELFDV